MQSACAGSARLPTTDKIASSDAVVVDFRNYPVVNNTTTSETLQTNVVQSVFGSNYPKDVQVSGSLHGRFLPSAQPQTLYLLTRGLPVAATPTAKPAMLAVFENNEVVSQFVLTGANYTQLLSTVDIDGNGTDEFLLRADSYQMGSLFSSVELYNLANGKRVLLKRFEKMYVNTCEASLAGGTVIAGVLSQRPGLTSLTGDVLLLRETYKATCEAAAVAPPSSAFVSD